MMISIKIYTYIKSNFSEKIAKEYFKKEEELLKPFLNYINNFVENFKKTYDEKSSLLINLIPVHKELINFYDLWFEKSLKTLKDLLIDNKFEIKNFKKVIERVGKRDPYNLLSIVENKEYDIIKKEEPSLQKIILNKYSGLWFSNYMINYLLKTNLEELYQELGYPLVVSTLERDDNEFTNKFNVLSLTKIWKYVELLDDKNLSLKEKVSIAFVDLFAPLLSFIETKLTRQSVDEFRDFFFSLKSDIENSTKINYLINYVKDNYNKTLYAVSIDDLRNKLSNLNIRDNMIYKVLSSDDETIWISGLCFSKIKQLSNKIKNEINKEFNYWVSV